MIRMVLFSIFISLVLAGCGSGSQEASHQNTQILCGTQVQKNTSLWQLMNEVYLWNDRLDPSTDPADFESFTALLEDVKAKNPEDRFSSVLQPRRGNFEDAINTGVVNDNGLAVTLSRSQDQLLAGIIWPGSPADLLGIKRGDAIISINNNTVVDILQNESNPLPVIDELIYGSPNAIEIRWQNSAGAQQQGLLERREFAIETLFHDEIIETEQGKIGYVVFVIFIPQAVEPLNAVFQRFLDAQVDHLIIDLRLNGGGCCMDTQLESQIAGENVIGKLAGRTIFNENQSDRNTSSYFALNNSIPAFDMDSVTFLTGKGTASASEGMIAALTPYIDVKLVGETTYGKNARQGIYDICGETVFITQFTGENADGFRVPSEGLTPTCFAEDTFNADWGDEADPLLAEALFLYRNGYCSS